MKIITHQDILNLNITPKEAYDWSEFVIKNKNSAILPPKISIKPETMEGVFCNVMPCYFGDFGGVKMVTRYPDRAPSLDSQLMLLDTKTGVTKALIDANFITALRTGAVCVHSLLLFAVKDFSTIGMMGLGNVARATMLILLAKVTDRKLTVKLLKFNDEHQLFADRFKDYENVEFKFCDTAEEVVDGSDVVISAVTYAGQNLCEDKYFKPGVVVIPVHTLGFTNCDLFFDKVFADDYGHVKHFKYFDKFKSFAEVSDVVNGKKAGRENDEERILVYNIGIALHDIYYAGQIYSKMENSATEIEFLPPTDRFWL
ncbi:MAG: ornithine cyclodeaminase family protein [Clostridia bacterium]|nr:ornithine cyclodeaminase family protein [Clostridia bacterium]